AQVSCGQAHAESSPVCAPSLGGATMSPPPPPPSVGGGPPPRLIEHATLGKREETQTTRRRRKRSSPTSPSYRGTGPRRDGGQPENEPGGKQTSPAKSHVVTAPA